MNDVRDDADRLILDGLAEDYLEDLDEEDYGNDDFDDYEDFDDYDDFDDCLSGPNGELPESECRCFDFDNDNDVDLSDIHRFQQAFTGG